MDKKSREPLEPCQLRIFTDRNSSKIRMALTFDVLKNCSLFKYKEYSFLCIKTASKNNPDLL
jgi:hypothetical protein